MYPSRPTRGNPTGVSSTFDSLADAISNSANVDWVIGRFVTTIFALFCSLSPVRRPRPIVGDSVFLPRDAL